MRVREFVLAERQRSFPATKRGEVVGRNQLEKLRLTDCGRSINNSRAMTQAIVYRLVILISFHHVAVYSLTRPCY